MIIRSAVRVLVRCTVAVVVAGGVDGDLVDWVALARLDHQRRVRVGGGTFDEGAAVGTESDEVQNDPALLVLQVE